LNPPSEFCVGRGVDKIRWANYLRHTKNDAGSDPRIDSRYQPYILVRCIYSTNLRCLVFIERLAS
jgi:hypothetical protein